MRRRSHPAVMLVALLAVGGTILTSEPRGSALAADPQTELEATQQQLAAALATQQQLAQLLADQKAQLQQLERESADMSARLDLARSELAAVTAEYDRVAGLLVQVRDQVAAITAHLVDLRAQIASLDAQLRDVWREIASRTEDLADREALLEEHLRSAYEQSQTSLLEVILSADSLDEASTQVGYLLSVSDQDVALADEIRVLRAELELRRVTLRDGRRALADARAAARSEEALLTAQEEELTLLETDLARLQLAAEEKQAAQEAALNAAVEAEGNVEAQIAANEQAAAAAADLAAALREQAAAQQAAVDEARRRAAEEAARNADAISARGFRWPEVGFEVTQEWGPTGFVLEPPYNYKGTYYPHFHGGIDISAGCGQPIHATGPGVVVASGQPLWPFDSGYGVVVSHGDGVQTWYWHLQSRVVVSPGTVVTGQNIIGYEGSTGNSTGCHLHFSFYDNGWWENPRWYLP